MATKKRVVVLLTEQECQRLRQLADESCRTRAGYIRKIISTHLRDVEENPGRKLL